MHLLLWKLWEQVRRSVFVTSTQITLWTLTFENQWLKGENSNFLARGMCPFLIWPQLIFAGLSTSHGLLLPPSAAASALPSTCHAPFFTDQFLFILQDGSQMSVSLGSLPQVWREEFLTQPGRFTWLSGCEHFGQGLAVGILDTALGSHHGSS